MPWASLMLPLWSNSPAIQMFFAASNIVVQNDIAYITRADYAGVSATPHVQNEIILTSPTMQCIVAINLALLDFFFFFNKSKHLENPAEQFKQNGTSHARNLPFTTDR